MVNINTSCAKAFFKEVGIRSDPEAVVKFKELLISAGKEIVEKAAESARNRNRKTVSVEDFN